MTLGARPAPTDVSPPLWGWTIAGACTGLALSLLLFAPAHWLASAVGYASGERVRLTQAQGTIWNGSAQLVFSGGADSHAASTLPSRLHWHLRPFAWGIGLNLQADCCISTPLRLEFRPRWGGFSLDINDTRSGWPAALLTGLGTPWNTMKPQGQLLLSSHGLKVDRVAGRIKISGTLQLEALDFSSRLSTLRPLGSYQITFRGGERATLTLVTLQGNLQIQGQGSWVDNRLRFEGSAQATPEHEDALSSLLNIIGRRTGPSSIITIG